MNLFMANYLTEFSVFPILFIGFSSHEIHDLVTAHNILFIILGETDLESHDVYFVVLELGVKIIQTFTDSHVCR